MELEKDLDIYDFDDIDINDDDIEEDVINIEDTIDLSQIQIELNNRKEENHD